MVSALTLSLRQMFDPAVLRIMAKSVGLTLVLFALLGFVAWHALDVLLAWIGLNDSMVPGAKGLRGAVSVLLIVIGGWLLWRIVAVAVLQFHADEVVMAVERRHYPSAAHNVRALGWRRELKVAMRGALRALGYNLLALPVALILLVTGLGTALVFLAVNALLIGRELTEMVWLRHAHEPNAPLPLGRLQRFGLGGIVAVLFIVPFANLLAPIFGAALATHLLHSEGPNAHET